MLLMPGIRVLCAEPGTIVAPMMRPIAKIRTVRIARSSLMSIPGDCAKGAWPARRVKPCGEAGLQSKTRPTHLLFDLGDDVEVLVVLGAHVLEQLRVRPQDERQGDVPRPRVGLGIVDCDPDLHVAEVLAP